MFRSVRAAVVVASLTFASVASADGAAAPTASSAPGTVDVGFESDVPRASIFVGPVDGPRETLRFVCKTPCHANVRPGPASVAVATDGPFVRVPSPVTFTAGDVTFVLVTSNADVRRAGALTLAAGGAAGLTMIGTGASFLAAKSNDQGGVLLAVGAIVTAASAIVGALLAPRADEIRLRPAISADAWNARMELQKRDARPGLPAPEPSRAACDDARSLEERAAKVEGPAHDRLLEMARRKAGECARAVPSPAN
ncbi:MAG: hypothetical protein U0169_26200 [Polyangiaceae bacterium]